MLWNGVKENVKVLLRGFVGVELIEMKKPRQAAGCKPCFVGKMAVELAIVIK